MERKLDRYYREEKEGRERKGELREEERERRGKSERYIERQMENNERRESQ